MPRNPLIETEEAEPEEPNEDRDDENRFSQDDDDTAGRSWHGMNSEIDVEDVGRFDPEEDDEDLRRS
jgi:hypothetical protein